MEPVWYFLSRAAATLIPLILIAFGAGLWAGWIKWHTWKREYNAVERDYHKLHDIHDVARATIPELEQRREALTGEIGQLEGLLGEYKDANEKFQAESERLNASLRATKRNYEALEEIWRVKLATAELRIQHLEASLAQGPMASVQATSPRTHSSELTSQNETIASSEAVAEADTRPEDDEKRLIPFPAATTGELLPLPNFQTNPAPQKTSKKSKNRRAV